MSFKNFIIMNILKETIMNGNNVTMMMMMMMMMMNSFLQVGILKIIIKIITIFLQARIFKAPMMIVLKVRIFMGLMMILLSMHEPIVMMIFFIARILKG